MTLRGLRKALCLIGLGVLIVTACGCKAKITVTPTAATIEVSQTVALSAASSSNRDTAFAWTSDNPAVATVDQNGLVTGLSVGQSAVRAAGNHSGQAGTATVTVVAHSPEGEGEGESEGEGEHEGEGGTPLLECPAASIFGQLPNVAAGYQLSAEGSYCLAYEDFSNLSSPIGELAWWGVTLDSAGASCTPVPNSFRLTFFADDAGQPGEEIATFNLPPQAEDTGETIDLGGGATAVHRYSVTLPSPVDLAAGWVSIVSTGDGNCWFRWAPAATAVNGSLAYYNSGYHALTDDRSLCLGPAAPKAPLSDFSISVDTGITPPAAQAPPAIDGGMPRPLATIFDERGRQAEFVENELMLMTNDSAALSGFLSRWNGALIQTIYPSASGIDMPAVHLVRIDTDLADAAQLQADILALDPHSRGASRVSSDAGLHLLAAGAHEAAAGLSVGVNWVGQGDTIADHSTHEAPLAVNGTDGFNSSTPYFLSNAFDWNFLNSGSTQDIGVTDAWWLLEKSGRINNRVKVAILDMGFALTGNLDVPAGWEAYSNVPFTDAVGTANLGSCGDSACPWHGTGSIDSAMGVPDNGYGGAGPGGPVAQPVLVFTYYDFFTSIRAISVAMSHGARIINMSYGAAVPAAVSWSVLPFNVCTTAASAAGALLFASAGNNGWNVDEEDCFIVCWEEDWITPCENGGVICVGGLAKDSQYRDGGSNYGPEDVDIFAPYTTIVGADPNTVIPAPGTYCHAISGTSESSPYTAGVAALIWAANPALSKNEVANILFSTAHTSPDGSVPRYVNAQAAVRQALGALIKIQSPADGASISRGTDIGLQAFILEGGRGTPTITWSSSIDGVIGSGASASRNDLSFGTHTITATAAFGGGFTAYDSVTITVVNDPPVVHITSPLMGSAYFQGSPVTLSATSHDPNNLPDHTLSDAQMHWFIDGILYGAGHHLTIPGGTLSLGIHTIGLEGTDGIASNTDSVLITTVANPANLPPDTVNITQPPDGLEVYATLVPPGVYRYQIELQGNAHDPEDGPLMGASLVWSTTLEGISGVTSLGTGSPLTVWLDAPGCNNYHNITLTARDSFGNTSHTSVRVLLKQVCK